MKIAFVLDTFPALSETFILNQITALLDKGFEIKIYAAKDKRKLKNHSDYQKYKLSEMSVYEADWERTHLAKTILIIRLCCKLFILKPHIFFKLFFLNGKLFDYHILRSVLPVINAPQFDIIHAHFGPNGVKVAKLQKLGLLNAPLICSFHGFDVDHNNYRRNPLIYKNLFKKAKTITGNSKYTIQNIEKLGCNPDKLRLVPETLYTDYFRKRNIQRDDSEVFQIITVARLVEFKGVYFSIMAIKKLVDQSCHNLHYSIIGDGPLRRSLEQIVIENNLQRYITFWGSQTQDFIINQFSKSDIFVLSGIAARDGREENQGLVIQEAQAMELPVIVSKIGGVPEGLENGETGFLIEPEDIDNIVIKIRLLMNDETLRKKMGKKAREFVVSKFDTKVKIAELIELYNGLKC